MFHQFNHLTSESQRGSDSLNVCEIGQPHQCLIFLNSEESLIISIFITLIISKDFSSNVADESQQEENIVDSKYIISYKERDDATIYSHFFRLGKSCDFLQSFSYELCHCRCFIGHFNESLWTLLWIDLESRREGSELLDSTHKYIELILQKIKQTVKEVELQIQIFNDMSQ